jgi:hypothetical protein
MAITSDSDNYIRYTLQCVFLLQEIDFQVIECRRRPGAEIP